MSDTRVIRPAHIPAPIAVEAPSFLATCSGCRATYRAGVPDSRLLEAWMASHADHEDGRQR